MVLHTGSSSLFGGLRCALAFAILGVAPVPALAHQIYIFAKVDGRTIGGRVYFRGNAPAQNVTVRATDPDGNELGRTTTDEQGKFTLPARGRVEHRLAAETGDGHVTEPYVLPAKLFQETPPEERKTGPAAPVGRSPTPSDVGRSPTPSSDAGRSTAPSTDESARIEQLNDQLDALQEQLAASQSRLLVRDVLGGIGWIVGLSGIAYYYLGVRRKRM